jgi:hypothetical protein
MDEPRTVLDHNWRSLLTYRHVLNIRVATKFKNGQDTNIPAIVVYVSKKLPEVHLAAADIIPKELEGVPTDVVEFSPTTWKAGKTSISQLHPEDQKRRLGARISPQEEEEGKKTTLSGQPSGQSDWTDYAQPIQDQVGCGSCVSFDVTGVWEAIIKIISGQSVKLSESHLFFCGGGRCNLGSMPEDILNQALKGVCLESCLPYSTNVQNGNDEYCQQGICANWWRDAKKLTAWEIISDPNEILLALDSGPLVATMAVPQSFLNYTGGIYSRLQFDPIIGYHGIGTFGYFWNCFKIIRNSWGDGWGQDCVINGVARPGWCMLAPAVLDKVMYKLTPDGPVPEPAPPAPSGCWLCRAIRRLRGK